jgi:hypothetical protein
MVKFTELWLHSGNRPMPECNSRRVASARGLAYGKIPKAWNTQPLGHKGISPFAP